jgi:hypothetical protein
VFSCLKGGATSPSEQVKKYDPAIAYGPAEYYLYPFVTYPAWGYAAGAAIAFGAGVLTGAFWNGGWGGGAAGDGGAAGAAVASTLTITTASIGIRLPASVYIMA